MNALRRRFRRTPIAGFTLVELLVVIAIIAVLLALLLPAVGSVRESARRTSCANNLRQLGIGAANYIAANGNLPPASTATTSAASDFGKARHGTYSLILPFLEQGGVYDKLDFSLNWNHADNVSDAQVDLPILVCPSAPGGRQWVSDYSVATRIANPATESNVTPTKRGIRELVDAGKVANRGGDGNPKWDGLMQVQFRVESSQLVDYRVTPAHCRDGLSNTIMFVEAGGRPFEYDMNKRQVGTISGTDHQWASPDNYFVINYFCLPSSMTNCSNVEEVFSLHQGGCNYAMGDGSVRPLEDSIDPEVFTSLFTRAAGDIPDMSGL